MFIKNLILLVSHLILDVLSLTYPPPSLVVIWRGKRRRGWWVKQWTGNLSTAMRMSYVTYLALKFSRFSVSLFIYARFSRHISVSYKVQLLCFFSLLAFGGEVDLADFGVFSSPLRGVCTFLLYLLLSTKIIIKFKF